jgi:diadenosine tetraphosphate (Ap4A) HIT family hydrolase
MFQADSEQTDINRAKLRLQKLGGRHTEAPESESTANPFLSVATDKPLIGIKGLRNGYLMLAPSREILAYAELPENLFNAARAWAAELERLGSPRAYWITLSEANPHLHIHLFPRWPEDTLKGIPLFETREQSPHPAWTDECLTALQQWAVMFNVELV